jgi:polynucleotide 5'-kinase involved in rRNA processing
VPAAWVHPPKLPPAPPDEWRGLLDELPPTGRLMVVGGTDAGKTTLVWWLARELEVRGATVGLVDADVGQSRIGPPGTVGWLKSPGGDAGFYFVGCTSPAQRPASVLKATTEALEAVAGCEWTLLDTTGYIRGELGVALKGAKIKRLLPVHVVMLGDDPGLAEVAAPWKSDGRVSFHLLGRSVRATEKTVDQRTDWRREAFRKALSGSNLRWIEEAQAHWLHAPDRALFSAPGASQASLRGLLLGFADADGHGLCLGLLQSVDFAARKLLALCPEAAEEAAVVDFGCLRLDTEGREIR